MNRRDSSPGLRPPWTRRRRGSPVRGSANQRSKDSPPRVERYARVVPSGESAGASVQGAVTSSRSERVRTPGSLPSDARSTIASRHTPAHLPPPLLPQGAGVPPRDGDERPIGAQAADPLEDLCQPGGVRGHPLPSLERGRGRGAPYSASGTHGVRTGNGGARTAHRPEPEGTGTKRPPGPQRQTGSGGSRHGGPHPSNSTWGASPHRSSNW